MTDSQPPKSQAALFQVYLRLRPPPTPPANSSQQYPIPERFLSVDDEVLPTHITLNPPNDNRRRAVEKFAFTKVFEEDSSQLDLFRGTGVVELVEGVLGSRGGEGRDGLLATLGVTGSGKVTYIPYAFSWCLERSNTDRKIEHTEPHHPRIAHAKRSNTTRTRCPLPLPLRLSPRSINDYKSTCHSSGLRPLRSTSHVRADVP
jgi:hypothetical protein